MGGWANLRLRAPRPSPCCSFVGGPNRFHEPWGGAKQGNAVCGVAEVEAMHINPEPPKQLYEWPEPPKQLYNPEPPKQLHEWPEPPKQLCEWR